MLRPKSGPVRVAVLFKSPRNRSIIPTVAADFSLDKILLTAQIHASDVTDAYGNIGNLRRDGDVSKQPENDGVRFLFRVLGQVAGNQRIRNFEFENRIFPDSAFSPVVIVWCVS